VSVVEPGSEHPRPEPGEEPGLTRAELADAVGLSLAGLARLAELGLCEPVAPGSDRFPLAAAVSLRRVLRLRAGLGVDWYSLAIIEDLLERIERLEVELNRLRGARD